MRPRNSPYLPLSVKPFRTALPVLPATKMGASISIRMWSSAKPSFVVQSIRTLDGQDASELRYAAAVTTWVRWTFLPACGAETSHRVEHGVLSPRPDRRHPAAAPGRPVPVRRGAGLRRLPIDRLARRAGGVAARAHSTLVWL